MHSVTKDPIDSKPALIQVMAWRRPGDKLLPELLMTQIIDAYMPHYGEMISWWWYVETLSTQLDCY